MNAPEPVAGNILMGLTPPVIESIAAIPPAEPVEARPVTASEGEPLNPPAPVPEPATTPVTPLPDLASVQAALEVFRQVEAYLAAQ